MLAKQRAPPKVGIKDNDKLHVYLFPPTVQGEAKKFKAANTKAKTFNFKQP